MPWGSEKEDNFAKPTHYDGLLEIVGVTGVVHMGQIQSGLRSAIRIAQGGHVSELADFDLNKQDNDLSFPTDSNKDEY